jgi:mono/diheme cytochrome c family protein
LKYSGKVFILTTLVILFAGGAWLSAQMEESDETDNTALIEQGRMLAEFSDTAGGFGCLNCHGTFGVGDLIIAPAYRGKTEEDVRTALENVEQMDFLNVNDDQIIALGAYLEWLGNFVPAKSELRDEGFSVTEAVVPVSAEVQIIIDNRERRTAHTVVSEDLGIEATEVSARTAQDFFWTAPDEPGTFTVLCSDCDEDVPALIIQVEIPEDDGSGESEE